MRKQKTKRSDGRYVIGVTATRRGLSDFQKDMVRKLLIRYEPIEVHHGDCVGGDEEIDQICVELDITRYAHPALQNHVGLSNKANCQTEYYFDDAPPLERNIEIVDTTDLLIGCPWSRRKPARGSGTWHAISYALSQSKKVEVIFRNEHVGHATWTGLLHGEVYENA